MNTEEDLDKMEIIKNQLMQNYANYAMKYSESG